MSMGEAGNHRSMLAERPASGRSSGGTAAGVGAIQAERDLSMGGVGGVGGVRPALTPQRRYGGGSTGATPPAKRPAARPSMAEPPMQQMTLEEVTGAFLRLQ